MTRTIPDPDLEFYKRHYGRDLHILDAQNSENASYLKPGSRYWLAAERIQSRTKPGDMLVEAGCGDARLLFEIARRSGIKRVVGIDGAFAQSTEIEGVHLLNHNLNSTWPFDDGEIDHLISMMVIEHLFDPFHAFSEIRRTLKPSGRAYINLPLVTAIGNRMRLLTGQLPVTSSSAKNWFESREWDGGHLHYFSLASIRKLAAACDLRVEEMKGVGRFHQAKSLFPTLLASEITFSLGKA